MEREHDRPAPEMIAPAAYETSSVATHRRWERLRTFVQRPRREARM